MRLPLPRPVKSKVKGTPPHVTLQELKTQRRLRPDRQRHRPRACHAQRTPANAQSIRETPLPPPRRIARSLRPTPRQPPRRMEPHRLHRRRTRRRTRRPSLANPARPNRPGPTRRQLRPPPRRPPPHQHAPHRPARPPPETRRPPPPPRRRHLITNRVIPTALRPTQRLTQPTIQRTIRQSSAGSPLKSENSTQTVVPQPNPPRQLRHYKMPKPLHSHTEPGQ